MRLSELMGAGVLPPRAAPYDPVVAGLTLDSRKVQPGFLFAALAGAKANGASFVADAVKRAGSTDADKMVDALEKTDWEGTIGRTQFYGKDDEFTHGLKYGKGLITGLMLQWQDGKQVSVWPKEVAKGQLKFPSFIKVTSN